MPNQPFLEEVLSREDNKGPTPRMRAIAYGNEGTDWVVVSTKFPPDMARFIKFVSTICRSSKSAVIRNVMIGAINDICGDRPVEEIMAAYDRCSGQKREFANRLWLCLTRRDSK